MLRLTFFEFIVRTIPESFLLVLSVYVLSKTKFDLKKYVISGIVLSIGVYLIRFLPISYGIHTMINIVILVGISIGILKVELTKSVRSSIVTAIILFLCEGLNFGIIKLFSKNMEVIFNNEYLKTLWGIPSLCIFIIVLLVLKFLLRKKNCSDEHTEVSKEIS